MIRECNVSYVFSVPVPCPMSWILEGNAFPAPTLYVLPRLYSVFRGFCKANGVPQDKRLMRSFFLFSLRNE
ncbi:hypothetical protein ACN38_g5347 [Penicillium nordicum]|uniref:Uncharacterized protein n=1 Tax=Penicillium nordicum TaxID=229535 RepID=A0A0M8P554_9EURO|nr:hypothetical protein ACN38_g5347 [Penicillium nordicum]